MTENEQKGREALEKFFEQVADVLNFALTKQSQPIGTLPDDIEKTLEKLEMEVEAFRQMNENIEKRAGITEEQLKTVSPSASNKDRRLLDRAEKLRSELDNMRQNLAVAMSIAKQREKAQGKTSTRIRQKKFDQLGRRGWKPL